MFLKRSGIACCVLLFALLPAMAQTDTSSYRHMLRVSEDNDIFKLLGEVSDKGYTNGTALQYFYAKDHASHFFLDRWMPKAGRDAINTFGFSLTQDMYTPSDIATHTPDVSDWPYTGGLYLTHSLHSSNAARKYIIKTEVVAGVMGKAALTKQMQTFIHSFIASDKPGGWDKAYPADVLLNLNLEYEHGLWSYGHFLEITGGGKAMLGTMMDGGEVYGYIRIGRIRPYFGGLMNRYSTPFRQKNHWQFYLYARPMLDLIAYNALLDGGVFSGKSDYYRTPAAAQINHGITRTIEYGALLAYGCISASFSQSTMPRLVDGIRHQRLGNVSLQVAF